MVALASVKGAVIFIGGAVTFIKGAVTFIGGAVMFVSKGGSAIGRLFETAGVRVGDIKGVNKRDLK